MIIHGREVKFLRTIAANCKIADLCPDGDVTKIEALFEGSYQKSQNTAAKFIAYLSEGYEMNRKYSETGYVPQPVTAEELLYLSEAEFSRAFDEAIDAYVGEKPTIETAPSKSKKKAEAKSV